MNIDDRPEARRENAKTARKRRTHEAILGSATTLVRERGIKASSVADVMRGAGLTVGGFYAHFPSKEALFVESIHGAARETWERFLATLPDGTARERARAVVRGYLSRVHRDSPASGCPLPAVAAEAAREGEPYRSALAEAIGRVVDELAALLAPAPDARERALGLLSIMYGALSLARAVGGTALSDELLLAARAAGDRQLPASESEEIRR